MVRRVLVAGGAGFIGSHYVRTLVSGGYPAWAGASVTVLDKLTYSGNLTSLDPVNGGFTFVHGDICDAELLARVVPGHDVVVNFAAETHVDRSITAPDVFAMTNVLGAHRLVRASLEANVGLFLQVSTDEVYGSIAEGSWTEDAPVSPNSPYAAAKAGGDHMALAYARTHGLDVRVTRCGNNYGPYQYPEKIIPLFVTRLLEGRKVPLYGDGRNEREWIHVDDHCRGIQLVAERGRAGEVYHVSGSTSLTNLELTERLLHALRLGPEMIDWVEDRKGHDRRYALDDSKLRSLGFRPATTFDDGLADTVRWYRERADWWRPLLRGGQ
ncbi:dTDP-glucose 4,6-dehydratase [Streptomyces sp. 8K308]|uniref:dTDP-glucose 4,6-dehydratase n=1 Tax=Streptomyces sp. 8K308 TaxID=2530388 RepID=UPI0010475205|nr:dTDP-glucose 4,6-dehydratase [Streptomyces sp. 8K308]TDC23584.1 dTDP-glucose 4,6-dehydratase [Streptomyces sp. 8K308]